MINIYHILVLTITAFLVGGIPFGLILGKVFKKTDIRKFGSGTIGATNAGRVLGMRYAIATFLLDGLKSFLPVLFAYKYYDIYVATYIAFFTVTGHIFSPWLGGKGGKGFASFILALLVIDYRLFLTAGIMWLICFKITKISGLSTLLSTGVVSISSYFLLPKFCFFVILILAIIIFYAHRENIKRLINGKELSFNKNKK